MEYLALDRGRPGFLQDFPCPIVLGIPLGKFWNFAYGAFTLLGIHFHVFPLFLRLPLLRSHNPLDDFLAKTVKGLGCSLFARRYSGNLIRFLLLRVLRCFSSPGFAPYRLWIHRQVFGYEPKRFPHSEIPGSKLVCSSPGHFGAYPVLLRLI